MLKIGITGGIGSGKSTVCNILKNLGVPIFDSDAEARKLLNENQELIDQVISNFGKDMYNAQGQLDRVRMANLVFNDPQSLEKLTSFVHPKVNERFEEWMLDHEHKSYVVKEAAILFESGNYHDLDKIINVFAPKEVRIKRVIKRDGSMKQNVEKRMRFQYTDEERNKLADFIIINEKLEDLLPQVMELHEIFLNEKQNEKTIFS